MNKKLKLASYVLKRYEPKLDTYFFYNLKSEEFWKTDSITGSIVASFDGSNTVESVIDAISSNSPEIPEGEIEEHFCNVFNFLIKEGFLCESDR